MSAGVATVAIVNWNGRHHLETCLPSVFALEHPGMDLECVVVDNGSTDGSVAWLGREWPAVRVVAHDANRGFAAAANDAATAASGDVVAFLNNDCRVASTWLVRLVEALRAEDAAAAGSCMLDWDGARVDFGGAAMNFHGHGSHRGWGRPYVADPAARPEPALFGCGGALAVDRARFLAAGGFDAEYFAYFEDVDLGWRFWVLGERVLYVPTAVAYHRHRGSSMDVGRWRFLLERNALASCFKNYEDASLDVVLPAARVLLAERARLARGPEAGAFAEAGRAFDARLPALRAARDAVQARRRRSDRDVLPLFREPFRPSAFGRVYWAAQRRVVHVHDLARVFGAATVAGADGLGDFIDELEGRIEELDARLPEPREG
ncbi:MAG: glycosyltransferase [Deltaproteobacteria bacterium]|nr:glycosyltransferase [Deltaproteobacteria bacterium]